MWEKNPPKEIFIKLLERLQALSEHSPSTLDHYNLIYTLVVFLAAGSIASDIHDVAPIPYSKIFTGPSYYLSGRTLDIFRNFSHTQNLTEYFLLIVSNIIIKREITNLFFTMSYVCDSFGVPK